MGVNLAKALARARGPSGPRASRGLDKSQTIRARELKVGENVHPPHIICHMSHVACNISVAELSPVVLTLELCLDL